MGKISELLINVVSIETPKLLTGVLWLVVPLLLRGTSSFKPPAERKVLTRSCDIRGTW